ncbi:possible RING-finger-like protein [Theileria orientalis strain Shintoku]|uniref:E3 ubiquitin protein ligase n=1 Tax=Theileria orientalis strain Shintoku TaxID=869250 RepID=J4CCR8_THEOR|nr:possible RING-finger-like protein [Theileria orientalis strain Shintoku]BAM39867.1 possible RING-finger-like protein [Theileria orientalis strain Shintoku]|eukprot:XP_009690168.1 possible RING-finger-like protein [Theileria orientalis strain Shintoku]
MESLIASISSLWDAMNADIELYLSQKMANTKASEINGKKGEAQEEKEEKGMFWEKMLTTKFPYVAPNGGEGEVDLDEFVYMFDNDQFLFPDDFYDEAEWEKVKEEYIESNMGVFQCKKEALVRSVRRARTDSNIDESGLVKALKYNCHHYGKMFFMIYDKYKSLKATHNSLKTEVSRLNKQNAFLKFELRAQSPEDAKKDLETASSSTESDAEQVKVVENLEEVTEEMILGSSLYNRLFNYAKNMDKEMARLEAENSELRTKISHLMEGPGEEYSAVKTEFDKMSEELRTKVTAFETDYQETVREAATLREKYRFVDQELERYKDENAKLSEELNRREMKISKLLQHNASICKAVASDNASDRSTPGEGGSSLSRKSEGSKGASPGDGDGGGSQPVPPSASAPSVASATSASAATSSASSASVSSGSASPASAKDAEFYKEQLLNISEELEEVSMAFEKKQRMCDELMRQLNEMESTRERLARTESAYASLKERFDKLVTVTNSKVSAHAAKSESLEKIVDGYRDAWTHAHKRAKYMQHQRDVAVSAVCELQAQYRRSCRAQKSLQDYVAAMRTGAARTPSMDASLGDVENLIAQENAVLRRRMTCSVCSENFRDHVIAKCGHVFCGVCLSNSIRSRNRKCPQCKITFDRNDTQRIFLD